MAIRNNTGFLFIDADEAKKKCKVCGVHKSVSEFHLIKGKYLYPRCKACHLVITNEWRRQNPDKSREMYKRSDKKRGPKRKLDRKKLRRECLDAYGGVCQCCGECRVEFLCLDHVLGGGNKHRRAMNKDGKWGGHTLYKWLKDRGFPNDPPLQVLCHNCNMALGFYGYCPHKKIMEKS